jgi:hypothetical protein
MEGRTENFTPGDNFNPGDKSQPRETTSPLGSKFAPRGEVKNGPLLLMAHGCEKLRIVFWTFLAFGLARFSCRIIAAFFYLMPRGGDGFHNSATIIFSFVQLQALPHNLECASFLMGDAASCLTSCIYVPTKIARCTPAVYRLQGRLNFKSSKVATIANPFGRIMIN